MPASFDYAIVRIVPRVEREEFMNAGVVLFCPEQRFLAAKVGLNQARLLALAPHIDLDLIRNRLNGVDAICAGDPASGPVANLNLRERFHWVVSPKSTILQMSAVHTGTCESAEAALKHLFNTLCL